jgi:hypothetical protein
MNLLARPGRAQLGEHPMASNATQGFAGSVSALSVVDVLQLQCGNRFSGSIVFSNQGQEAAVYFHDGEVVHAECGEARGEPALGAILSWPSGNFQTHANVATFARTIDKRLEHLLLDSLRRLDEERGGRTDATPPPQPVAPHAPPAAEAPRAPATHAPATHAAAPPAPASRARPAAGGPASAQKARAVPGVAYAAVLRGGAALHDPSPQAAALAARSSFLLGMLAAPLGRALGLGEVNRAALVTQQSEQLLLLHAQDVFLAVSISPDASLADTETQVRRAVNARPGA